MLSRDGWGGLLVLAGSLLLFWLTLDLKDSPLVPIGPGYYPRIVLTLTALFAVWLVVADWAGRRHRVAPAARPASGLAPNYAAVALHFGVFGLYVVSLPGLGFRIATFAYVAIANALMAPPAGWRGWARVVLLAFGTAFATWLVFERELSVLLPRGRWTSF